MVIPRQFPAALALLLLLAALAPSISQQSAWAADIQYHLEKQWVKIWINTDGTIDLQYTLRIVCDQGSIRYVTFDQPVGDFKIGEAVDENGQPLSIEDATEASDYKVRVYLREPIADGQAAELTATTNVGYMIWKDETNPGNVGFQFVPTAWKVNIDDLRVLVVFPAGVMQDQVRVTPDWDNAYPDPNEDGRLVVYWERKDVAPDAKFQVGVSFPETYVEYYETTQTTQFTFVSIGVASAIAILFFIVIIVVAARRRLRRSYLNPKMQMESLGVRRGFTAAEAAYLLGIPPTKVIVMILYGLLLKRAVWVTSSQPSLKLQISDEFNNPQNPPADRIPRYYEKDFFQAIRSDGRLDEKALADTFMRLRSSVDGAMAGFCRADTVAFYRKTVQEAWGQVEKAGTSDAASNLFDQDLLWLMLDDDFKGKSHEAFKEFDFQPLPFWWWYWYGYSQYDPNPTYNPTVRPGQPPPSIPGAEFANSIATSLEKTTNNIVVSIEKFTNSILPAPLPKDVSRTPVHHDANCACACVSCACACACVSCACACASGGGVG